MSTSDAFHEWLRQERATQHGTVPSHDPFAPGYVPILEPPNEVDHREVHTSHYVGLHGHHAPRKWWVILLEAFAALFVANLLAMAAAFLSIFVPINGIPAVVGIGFGIIAIFCAFSILFIRSHWKIWLDALGVGLGFYIIWFLAFWG